jgi:hypothetical protein
MEQIAIVARLKPGAGPQAASLLAEGPPYDPEANGLARHTVYLSADEVVFVFEGNEVEWIVDGLIDEPFHWALLEALEAWRPLLEENPRIARPAYAWARDALAAGAT